MLHWYDKWGVDRRQDRDSETDIKNWPSFAPPNESVIAKSDSNLVRLRTNT